MSDLFPDPEPQAERLDGARLDVVFAADALNAALAECSRVVAAAREAQHAMAATDIAQQGAVWRTGLDQIDEALRLVLGQAATLNKELRTLLDMI